MIDRRELLDAAKRFGLNPGVVEKDYALGWALAGIYAHPDLASYWVFKGGTCLKKCYFETYRFSEDLDFTLKDESHLDEAFLRRIFVEVSEWIYEQSGLEFPPGQQSFEILKNPRGNLSCQGKLSYRGPVSPNSGGLPRIKLDLTADERLVLDPVEVPIFHPYSDAPPEGITVLAYAYVETFAEKIRALAERTRPRDLYDVVNLFRNEDARPEPTSILNVLREKCDFKGISVPHEGDFDPHRADLEAAWRGMLAHQLPALPPVEAFWNALPDFFRWLTTGEPPARPVAYAMAGGDTLIRERRLPPGITSAAASAMEIIRFSAANRLCVDLDYQGGTRRIEPYSLRRTMAGDIILHAWSRDANEHRSYRVDRIQGARSTSETFVPRYSVELTPSGPISILAASRSGSGSLGFGGAMPRATRPPKSQGISAPRRRPGFGPTYVYQCPFCRKKFSRKALSSALNPHKSANGFSCPGRTGFLVETKY
ncbi:MAG: nucleotidyl transferase AbiEii/AbiGii toxin family protein [Paracoccaceae bacterium]